MQLITWTRALQIIHNAPYCQASADDVAEAWRIVTERDALKMHSYPDEDFSGFNGVVPEYDPEFLHSGLFSNLLPEKDPQDRWDWKLTYFDGGDFSWPR